MARARWLAAVSGGNYASTAWTLARVDDRSGHAAADVIDWLNSPIPYSKSPKHRFLRNGPGGLGRSMIAAMLYIAFNVAVLGALVAAVAWPIGRLIGSKAIQPNFRIFGALPSGLEIHREHWLPAVALLVLAGILLLVSALPSWGTSWLWRPAVLLAAIGVAVGLLTVVIPWAMAFVGNWLRRGDHDFRAASTGLAALFGALGIVWRLARKPVLTPVRPQAAVPRRCCCSPSPASCGPARWPPTRPPASDCCRHRHGGRSSSPPSSSCTCSSGSPTCRSIASTASGCAARSAFAATPTAGCHAPHQRRPDHVGATAREQS